MATLSSPTNARLAVALADPGCATEIANILNGACNGNVSVPGNETITGTLAVTGTSTFTGAITPTGGLVYGARIKKVGGRLKSGTTAGFVVGAGNNVGSLATVAASQTSATLVAYVEGLNHGDIITGIRVTASINCTTNNASLDAALHTYTVTAGATATDAAVTNGAITQILQTGTGALAGTSANGTACSSTVATGVEHFVLLTATTGASCTIELNTIEITYIPNPAQ